VSGYLFGIDPDRPVFRIVRAHRFLEDVASGQTRLISPSSWEDPQEDVITLMGFTYEGEGHRQRFAHQVLPPVFAQCWSMTEESDPLWRAYSRVSHDEAGQHLSPNDEGLQIRSTPRKLLAALMSGAPDRERCFVGSVHYVSRAGIAQEIVDEVNRAGLESFGDPIKRARAALYKRDAYSHEAEVRTIYVGQTGDQMAAIDVRLDHNDVIDLVTLDGRLTETERRAREDALRGAGRAPWSGGN